MTTLQAVFLKTQTQKKRQTMIIISCDYDMTMTMIGWFVYVVCLSDAKSCENNVYLAILGKHDVFPGNTMFSQCTLENTRFTFLSCKKLGFRCTRYIYIYIPFSWLKIGKLVASGIKGPACQNRRNAFQRESYKSALHASNQRRKSHVVKDSSWAHKNLDHLAKGNDLIKDSRRGIGPNETQSRDLECPVQGHVSMFLCGCIILAHASFQKIKDSTGAIASCIWITPGI